MAHQYRRSAEMPLQIITSAQLVRQLALKSALLIADFSQTEQWRHTTPGPGHLQLAAKRSIINQCTARATL
jgi:hypothetical protein